MRVLLIEDDDTLARSLTLAFGKAGIDTQRAAEAKAGLELARSAQYDAIILDLMLPDSNGLDMLRLARAYKVQQPVVIISGHAETSTKIACLNAGADDYVVKPFETGELIARLHALRRRSQGHSQAIVTVGPITIDLASHQVCVDGKRVALTATEFKLLELMALRKGKTLPKDYFVLHLYEGRKKPDSKIIDVFVCKIRRKLHEAGAPESGHIATMWGMGYALQDKPGDAAA